MDPQDRVLQDLPSLLSASTIEQVNQRCRQLISLIGLDLFLIGMELSSCKASTPRIETNYPSAWMERYQNHGWMRHDPVVAHCRRSDLPMVWRRSNFSSVRAQQLFEEASVYGISAGVATCIHRAGQLSAMMMTVACDERDASRADRWLQQIVPVVHLMCAYVYEAITHLGEDSPNPTINLTRREHECLHWVAAGKTSWETSRILACSESTVNFHIRNVIDKLEVSNRHQAVARSISLGLVSA